MIAGTATSWWVRRSGEGVSERARCPNARTLGSGCRCVIIRPVLEDGSYDAIVVDATVDGDVVALDLTILDGPHKGEVVAVRATGLHVDELDVLGLPGTLVVENGVPRFDVER